MIAIEVSESEFELIVNTLAELPHKLVHTLIPNLIAQYETQKKNIKETHHDD